MGDRLLPCSPFLRVIINGVGAGNAEAAAKLTVCPLFDRKPEEGLENREQVSHAAEHGDLAGRSRQTRVSSTSQSDFSLGLVGHSV